MAIFLNECGAKTEGGRMASDVAHMLNNYDTSEQQRFVEQMSHEHRTLQQGFTRLCVAWFRHLAELKRENGEYDLRLEASVELAKRIVAKIGDDLHLPLV